MSRRPIGAEVLLLLTAAGTVNGHDLKVLVNHFNPEPGGKVTTYLSWGHALPVDELIDAKTIERYEMRTPAGDAKPLKLSDVSLQANLVPIDDAGIYQVVVARKATVLAHVLNKDGKKKFHRGGRSTVKEGTVVDALRSQQFAKALVVSGTPGKLPAPPVGLPLEIVPVNGPAAWRTKQSLRFQVLHHGKPLPDAKIVPNFVGYRPVDEEVNPLPKVSTGLYQITPVVPGSWVLTVQHRVPAAEKDRAEYDFEAYTATLSFEVRP